MIFGIGDILNNEKSSTALRTWYLRLGIASQY
jgi:hypothetical protein